MGLFFDTTGMTADDLMKKEMDVRVKYMAAFRMGVSGEVIAQFQNILDDLKLARMEPSLQPGYRVPDDPDTDDEPENTSLNIG